MAVLDHPFPALRTTPRLRLAPVLIVAALAIITVALLRVVQTSDVATTNFHIQQLEQERLEMRTRVGQVEAQIAALSSLSRIEREARERLGLEPPAAQRTVAVNVPWPAAEQQLPTRFAPDEDVAVDEQGSAWWRDLLHLLPFY